MKHLKKFKLFESEIQVKTKEEVIEDIKDIFYSELADSRFSAVSMDGKETGNLVSAKIYLKGSSKCWTNNSDLEIIPIRVSDDITQAAQSLRDYFGGTGATGFESGEAMDSCKIGEFSDFITRLLDYKESNSLDIKIMALGVASHLDTLVTWENLSKLCDSGMVIRCLAIRIVGLN